MQLSLDCLTMTDTPPAELIECAGTAGFDAVTVWTNPPSQYPRQVMTPAMLGDCLAALDSTGVKVHSVEAFDLASAEAIEGYRPAFELASRLGAKAALTYHLDGPGGSEAADLLALMVEMAGEYGLGINLEPISMGRTRTLAEASELVRASGANAGICFDTLHLMRSSGNAGDVAGIDTNLIRHIQINDGPLQLTEEEALIEASGERLFPGQGAFPLADLLRNIPRDIPWGIEVPSVRSAASGKPPIDHARDCMASLLGLLERMGIERR